MKICKYSELHEEQKSKFPVNLNRHFTFEAQNLYGAFSLNYKTMFKVNFGILVNLSPDFSVLRTDKGGSSKFQPP